MKPCVKEVIVVEGKYDKNTLSQIVDATILETSGFAIFKDKQMLPLLRKIAQDRGIIILTDSDGAGFVIRNYIKSAIPQQYVKHAYIPDIFGKEKRKQTAGKEGKIGVEGMSKDILLQSLTNAGATIDQMSNSVHNQITKVDFFEKGLIGEGSKAMRDRVIHQLNLPKNISSVALQDVLNVMYSREEFLSLEF